jgi:polysaccharide export outer membrane protein
MKYAVLILAGLITSGCAQTWDDNPPAAAPGGLGVSPTGQIAEFPNHTATIPHQPAYNGVGTVQPFGASGEATAYEFEGGYRVGAGDRLTIRVLGQLDLTGDYLVDGAGNISMPLVRSLPVAGLSTPAIEEVITAKLQQGFLRKPSVSVQLAVARPFYIMGQVGAAGSFPYRAGMTVQNAIALAGGYSARADQNNVLITRKLLNGTNTVRVPVTAQLYPGDIVFVRERWF